MSIFSSINISASALNAERTRMDVISKNLANANTTRTQSGDPYRRQVVVFQEANEKQSFKSIFDSKKNKDVENGVEIVGIVEDKTPFRQVYNPGHPDADEKGYVTMSNVDTITEMVDMISATRSYEANVTALNTSKGMLLKALEIGK